MEWAAQYPDLVESVIHVIGPGFEMPAYNIGLLDLWCEPIMLDPNWNGGEYYGRAEPIAGLTQGLKVAALTAHSPAWAAVPCCASV